MKVYLDNAATTMIKQEVLNEMMPFLTNNFHNASSMHNGGIQNRKIINTCKKTIATILHCSYKELYFTSCGCEANNWAIKGIASKNPQKNEIITTKIEHHSILSTCEYLEKKGYIIHYLDVDNQGFINLSQLESFLNKNTLMVSIIMANNEIGVIQDINNISTICKNHNTILHVDAVQAVAHIPINITEMNVDLLSFSAHKFHGPKGIACLYIKKGIAIDSLIHGGQQEFGLRAGTENTAFIVGLTKALELGINNYSINHKKNVENSNLFLTKLQENDFDFIVNGPVIGPNRLSNNLSISFKDTDNFDLLFYLSSNGISASTGSACDSDIMIPSHVLQAINVPKDYISGTIRFSFSELTTKQDILHTIEILKNYFE